MSTQKYKLGEYIISNKEQLKKFFFREIQYVENTSVFSPSKNMVKKRVVFHEEISKKWSPIIESYLSNINLSSNMVNLISAYLEIISMYESYSYTNIHLPAGTTWMPNGNLIKDEMRIISEVIKKNPKRSKILGKYYNYNTAEVEYLLEDGNYIPIGTKVISDDLNLSIFPKEFVILLDESEYRNIQIDEILTNG